MKGRRAWERRVETSLEVLSGLEVEALILYCQEGVEHRFVGYPPLEGEGRGTEALRQTLVRGLRYFPGGLEGTRLGSYVGERHAVLEWRCTGRALDGHSEVAEGVFLVEHDQALISSIRGYFCPIRGA